MKRAAFLGWMTGMLLLALATAAPAQTTYRLEQIGPNPDPSFFYYGNDMNDKGEVVGGVYGTFSGWLWREGTITPIPPLPDASLPGSDAAGINNRTQVVGGSVDETSHPRPYLWQRGRVRDLGAFPGAIGVSAADLNTLGIIIGNVTLDTTFFPTPYVQIGTFVHTLEKLPGGHGAIAIHLNELGVICGYSDSPAGQRAVIWKWGHIQDLGVLPGGANSNARAINNRNEVAGEVRFGDGSNTVAVVWRDGQPFALPSLFTGPFSRGAATGINDREQVVGLISGLVGFAPALWQDGVVYDLNDLVRADDPLRPFVTLQAPLAINNRGQILVTGSDSRYPTGSIPYRLTPSGHL